MVTKNYLRRFCLRLSAWVTALGVATLTAPGSAAEYLEYESAREPAPVYTALGGGGVGVDSADDFVDPGIADFSGGFASAPTTAMAGLVGGYIDPAVIASRVRVRYDNFRGANAPTRAEYLYPTVGGLGGNGPPFGGGGALGNEVDFEEVSTYVEWAVVPRLSVFGDFPVRWVGPLEFGGLAGFEDGTQRGAGDFKFGFRYGLIASCDEALTFQTRVWTPTGNAQQALGVGHTSIDFSLLYQRTLNARTTFFAEIQDWQTTSDTGTVVGGPFDGADLGGNVLRWGVGLGYDVWQDSCSDRRLTGVFEVVGWEVLDGLVTPLDGNAANVRDANGDTIVNGKYGLRYSTCENSVYVGYGHNWTNQLWYSDLFRIEVAHRF